LTALTQEQGKIIAALNAFKPEGQSHFSTALRIAQLALKHRQNKSQRQRIIVFIASPILESSPDMIKLGKSLKMNGIAVDIVSIGEEATNSTKLEDFIAEVNNNDNSHLVTVPPSTIMILRDVLRDSPVIGEETSAHASQLEFGSDLALDPELAHAIRISLEEEQERQRVRAQLEEQEGQQRTQASMTITPSSSLPSATQEERPLAASKNMDEDKVMNDEDDESLPKAIAPSSSISQPKAKHDASPSASNTMTSAPPPPLKDVVKRKLEDNDDAT
jgi:26S proteasome regulatory subunit N10